MRILCYMLVFTASLAASAGDPYIGYLYPAGGAAGTTLRILVGGQGLGGLQHGLIDGGGVTVRRITPVPNFPNPDGNQRKYLLAWLKAIAAGDFAAPPLPDDTDGWRKNAWWDKLDRLDPLALNLVERDLHTRRNALQATPSIRQMLIVDMDIAPDAAPGARELRLWGHNGVSAPKLFFVDQAPHWLEPPFSAPGRPRAEVPRVEVFPAVLDGQIMPGETDSFVLRLTAGVDYTFALTGRRFQPFIGDAVPGHFQPVLRLLDPAGKEAAFADDEYFRPDPVLRFHAPATGDYQLEIRDNLYRGREDFVYRVAVTPGRVPYHFGATPFPGGDPISETAAAGRILSVEVPLVIAGIIANPGERDVFRFIGRAGQRVVCDAAARRSGSPLDGVLRLIGPEGRTIAEADDSVSMLNVGEILQQADPSLAVTLPADGEYRIELGDLVGAGGADYRYRLRLGPPQPDFCVYSVRSMLNLRPGSRGTVKLAVQRFDGFDGEIKLFCDEPGLLEKGGIPAGAAEGYMVLKHPAGPGRTAPRPIRIFAEAECGGKQIRHEIISADEFIQAFAYTHLLPAREFILGSLGGGKPQGARK